MLKQRTIHLFRAYKCATGYFGFANLGGHSFYTCERLPNNNKPMSCIPAGEYSLAPFHGRRFKNVFHVTNVISRQWILTHWGNTMADSRGCILFGEGIWSKEGNLMITHSRNACKSLWNCQPEKIIISEQ